MYLFKKCLLRHSRLQWLMVLSCMVLLVPTLSVLAQQVAQGSHTSFTIANQYLTSTNMASGDGNWLTYLLINQTSNTLSMPTGRSDSTAWFYLHWSRIIQKPGTHTFESTQSQSAIAKGPAGDVQYPWYVAPGDSAIFVIDLVNTFGEPISTLPDGFGIPTGQYLLHVDCAALAYTYSFPIHVSSTAYSRVDSCLARSAQKGAAWFDESAWDAVSTNATLLKLYTLPNSHERESQAHAVMEKFLSCPAVSLGALHQAIGYYSDRVEENEFQRAMSTWYSQLLSQRTSLVSPSLFRLIWKSVARQRGRMQLMPIDK